MIQARNDIAVSEVSNLMDVYIIEDLEQECLIGLDFKTKTPIDLMINECAENKREGEVTVDIIAGKTENNYNEQYVLTNLFDRKTIRNPVDQQYNSNNENYYNLHGHQDNVEFDCPVPEVQSTKTNHFKMAGMTLIMSRNLHFQNIFENFAVGVQSTKVSKARRIGRKAVTQASAEDKNYRVLVVMLTDNVSARTEMLRGPRKLHDSNDFKNVFINEDFTPSERLANRKLREERNAKNAQLTDTATVNGPIVKVKTCEDGKKRFLGIRNGELVLIVSAVDRE
ncbi:hypothetical protein BpHYR1_016448 [Brachionus plicatilis]|uniref:Uncharacterized protein n=1 Tax=Brachionus plicatilis TaxID=10195 RepID=A0A3M7PP69_BRAPC|nr:hypothetical protein BpHYR1_016448 [Brachionus plicatilis]